MTRRATLRIHLASGLTWGLTCGFLVGLLACGGGGGGSAPKPVLALTSTPKTTALEAHPYRYLVTASSPQPASLQFTLVSGPAGATLSGSTLDWTPDAALIGTSQAFKIRAADGATAQEQSWSVLVSANGVPAFSSTPPASAKEGHAYAYDLAALDPDGDGVQFVGAQLPPGATLTGTRLTWTPANAEVGQVVAFKVNALDGFGGSREQAWSVTPSANEQPVITSQPPADVSFVQGAPVFDYALTGTDADNDAITYTLVQAPAGATLVNGILHWQPTPSQERVAQTFQIHATDGHGGSTDQFWTKAYSGVLRGTWAAVFQSPSGATITGLDSTMIGYNLHAVIPDGSGGYRTINGALNPDGSMTLSGIPPGGYWVSFGSKGYLWTDRGTLDVGQAHLGRPDAVNVQTAAPLTLTLSNLNSWSSQDNLIWQVPNHAVQLRFNNATFTSNAPVPGDTGLSSAVLPHFGSTPLVEAAKADVLNLLQVNMSNQGVFYIETIGKSFTTSTLTQTEASGGSVVGAFVTPPTASVDLDWDAIPAANMKAQVRPDALANGPSLRIVAQPGGLANGWLHPQWTDLDESSSQPILAMAFPSGTAHFQQPLSFKDPYPASWPRIFIAATTFYAPNPPAASGIILTASDSPGTIASPLKAIISPIQHPTINGQDFFLDHAGVGLTPTLSWDPPALGTAVCYQIRIYTTVASAPGGGIGRDLSHDLTVFGTSVQIPPGILTMGASYVITVRAVAAGPGADPTVPYRFPLPLGLADCISGQIQP